MGSAKAKEKEPKSYSDRVFNFKLDCFVTSVISCHAQARPRLQLKNWLRFLNEKHVIFLEVL